MKKKFMHVLVLLSLCLAASSFAVYAEEEEEAPSLVEASLVTEVLDWGETVTGIRLEYSEEIYSVTVEYNEQTYTSCPYHMVTDRDVVQIYVNNSGTKGEKSLYGKYVFIDFGIDNEDFMAYRDQVTFDTNAKDRPEIPAYYLMADDIETRSGAVIAGGDIYTSNEICLGVDDFVTFTYGDDSDYVLYFHVYIPEGYEEQSEELEDLPLVVHFPSNDFLYTDWTGLYRGALFTHYDCTIWASEEVQSETPCFVVTMGSNAPKDDWKENYEDSWLQQTYMNAVIDLIDSYNIDTSRVYAISLAAGALDAWNAIIANPGLFAAEIGTSCDLTVFPEEDRIEKASAVLDEVPSWFFVGYSDRSGNVYMTENDDADRGIRILEQLGTMQDLGYDIFLGYDEEGELMWDGTLRGEEAEKQAEDFLTEASADGCDTFLTLYLPGTLTESMHWTWNATYSNAAVRSWLFSHSRD